jgi:hypothetical protein
MTRVVVDARTWARLSDPHELLELCDPSGQILGYYQPAFREGAIEENKIHSPYTDQEIEQRRRQSGGQTLAEFWKDRGQI